MKNRMAALHLIHRCVEAMQRAESEYHESGNCSWATARKVMAEAVLTEAGVLDLDGYLAKDTEQVA